jgi:hypothetical protein
MVLVPVGSSTTTSASDTQQDTQSAIGDAWKGAFDKAQSERSSSSANPTTIAGTFGGDAILPPPGLWPQAPPVVFGPFGPTFGPDVRQPEPPQFGPDVRQPEPPQFGPDLRQPEPPQFGPDVRQPPSPQFGPDVKDPPGTFEPPGTDPTPPSTEPTPLWVNYAKGTGKKPKQGKVEVTPLEKKPGRLEGAPEPENGNRAIKRQNESAKILSQHDGLWVRQLPNGKNPEGEKNPDLEISTNQGESWQKGDVKSPTSDKTKNIREDIEDARKQGTVAVVNLDDTKVSAGQVILNLKNKPIQGLNDIYVIKGHTVTRVSYGK